MQVDRALRLGSALNEGLDLLSGESSLSEYGANGHFGIKITFWKVNTLRVAGALLAIDIDPVSWPREYPTGYTDAVGNLVPRNHHAGTRSSTRAAFFQSAGTSNRTFCPAVGISPRGRQPLACKNAASSPVTNRSRKSVAIASLAHSCSSLQVSPSAFKLRALQTATHMFDLGS